MKFTGEKVRFWNSSSRRMRTDLIQRLNPTWDVQISCNSISNYGVHQVNGTATKNDETIRWELIGTIGDGTPYLFTDKEGDFFIPVEYRKTILGIFIEDDEDDEDETKAPVVRGFLKRLITRLLNIKKT